MFLPQHSPGAFQDFDTSLSLDAAHQVGILDVLNMEGRPEMALAAYLGMKKDLSVDLVG